MDSQNNEDKVGKQSPKKESTPQERQVVFRPEITHVEEMQVSPNEIIYVSQPPPPGTEETESNQPQAQIMNPFTHARITNWLHHVMQYSERTTTANPSTSATPIESKMECSSTAIEIKPSTSKIQDVVNVQLDNPSFEEFRRRVQEFCMRKCGPKRNAKAILALSRKRGQKPGASSCINWKRQRIEFRKKRERYLQVTKDKTRTSSSSEHSPRLTTFASQQQNAMDSNTEGEISQVPEPTGLPLFRIGRRERVRNNFRAKRPRKRDRTLSSGYPVWEDETSNQSNNHSDSELNVLSSRTGSSLEDVELDATLSVEEKLAVWLQHSQKYQKPTEDDESSSD